MKNKNRSSPYKHNHPQLHSHYHIIITGAGGWLGRAILSYLYQILDEKARLQVHAFGSTSFEISIGPGWEILCRPLSSMADLPPADYLLMHCAFHTADSASGAAHDAFIKENTDISTFVETQAIRLNIHRILVPSSGAVYRPDRTIDHDIEKNPYGVLRYRDEQRFGALASANTRVMICRVFNLSGPFMNKRDIYVLGSIITDICNGGPIRLQARHPVIRSYIHVMDMVQLIFALFTKPEIPTLTPFDIAGTQKIEVGDLAKRAVKVLGVPNMKIERPSLSGAEANIYVGDATEMNALMAACGITPTSLDKQIQDTATWIQQQLREHIPTPNA